MPAEEHMHPTRTSASLPCLLGDYELLSKLADGGVCSIYRGRHRATREEVAIKVLPRGTARRGLAFRRFEQEFRAANRLDHPNIVKALDFCGSHDTPYLVMELVEGESVGEVLHHQGPFPEAEGIRLLVDVCRALGYAHGLGVIHRDVKPDNILITRDGRAKLIDMGLAKELPLDNDLTRTGRGLGTPFYMAPEQFRDAKNAGVRSDVYGLGATLYHMLTGEVPFGTSSPMEAWLAKMKNKLPLPRQLNPDLTERTERAILRAMHPDPDRRQPSCDEFVQDLTGKRLTPASARVRPADLWHLRYAHPSGHEYALQQSTGAIRKLLAMGLLARARFVLVSRSAEGPFGPPSRYPEFQDLVPADGDPSLPPTPSAEEPGEETYRVADLPTRTVPHPQRRRPSGAAAAAPSLSSAATHPSVPVPPRQTGARPAEPRRTGPFRGVSRQVAPVRPATVCAPAPRPKPAASPARPLPHLHLPISPSAPRDGSGSAWILPLTIAMALGAVIAVVHFLFFR
jgi:serine/threonine protein kinase